jgi:hypothetical protein
MRVPCERRSYNSMFRSSLRLPNESNLFDQFPALGIEAYQFREDAIAFYAGSKSVRSTERDDE